MSLDSIYTLIPVAVDAPVEQGSQLTAPSNIIAKFSEGTGVLHVCLSITLPDDVTPENVTLEQYFSNDLGLQFYFLYDYSTPSGANYNSYTCEFDALDKDANNNPINLSKLTSLMALIQDIDPKTSRGTTASINHIKSV